MGSIGDVNAALARALHAGIRAVLAVSVTHADWPELATRAAQMAKCDSQLSEMKVFWAAGWHPWSVPTAEDRSSDEIARQLEIALDESSVPPVALGECGLDRKKGGELSRQIRFLLGHFRPAREREIPLVLHCVGCFDCLIALMDEHALPPSIVHSYAGAPELAHELVRRGHYIGISGAVCDPRAKRLRRTVAALPLDRLLIETDAPSQTPVMHRPAPNEPAWLVSVARAVAEIRGITLEELAHASHENALRVLRLSSRHRASTDASLM